MSEDRTYPRCGEKMPRGSLKYLTFQWPPDETEFVRIEEVDTKEIGIPYRCKGLACQYRAFYREVPKRKYAPNGRITSVIDVLDKPPTNNESEERDSH